MTKHASVGGQAFVHDQDEDVGRQELAVRPMPTIRPSTVAVLVLAVEGDFAT